MTNKEALLKVNWAFHTGYDGREREFQRAMKVIEKYLEVLEILLKYDVLSVIGIDEDKEKVKWYIATHKKLDL